MKNYVAEFIGTFAIVFCGTGAIIINDISGGVITHLGICIVFGLIVMVMIYAFGDTSGAHFNPAVSISLVAANAFSVKQLLPYLASQIAGAIAASGILKLIFPLHQTLGATLPKYGIASSFVLEFFMTFLLMLTVMMFVKGKPEKAPWVGIVIGAIILLEALFGGPVSGASMNPARSFAPALFSGNLQYMWLYIVAPCAGALSAVVISKFVLHT